MKFIFAILAAVIPWLFITVSPSFPFYKEICEEGYKSTNDYCTGYNVVLFFLIKIGKFGNDYGSAITAIATVILAFFTWRLWWSTEKLWGTTEKSIDLARDEFNSSHRPWITIKKIRVREQVNSNSPIFFLSYDLENVGHSPAFVLIRDEIIVYDPKIRWQDRQPEFCAVELEKVKSNGWEAKWTVFPGDPFPYHRNAVEVTGVIGKEGYFPILIGCIFYRAIWSDVIHKTPFVAWISKEPSDNPLGRGEHVKFSTEDGIILKDQIVVKDLCITGDAD